MKRVEIGQLVTTFVDSGVDMPMRVIGEVTNTMVEIRDGFGYVRLTSIDRVEASDINEQRIYWMDRALQAEHKLSRQDEVKAAVETIVGRTEAMDRVGEVE